MLVLDASGSMDDPMSESDTTKRIGALKNAAYSFIDKIALQNEGIYVSPFAKPFTSH